MSPYSVSSMLVLVVVSLLCACASAATGSPAQSAGNELKASLTTCIDDSDCKNLGDGTLYACFKYLCYPWQDDDSVPESERRDTCRKRSDCSNGESCFRHHDKRNVNRGLCFDDEVTDYCENSEDCTEGYGCCGGYCCEQEYYNKFTDLPCASDLGCQDMGLGKFCCPQTNATAVCCNTDPNPPPPTAPPSQSVTGAASMASVAASLFLAVVPVVAKLL